MHTNTIFLIEITGNNMIILLDTTQDIMKSFFKKKKKKSLKTASLNLCTSAQSITNLMSLFYRQGEPQHTGKPC